MSKFATLALMAVHASANWDNLVESQKDIYEDHHTTLKSSETSLKAKHLANLLGMDENLIYLEASDSLEEMAQAISDQNFDFDQYAEHEQMNLNQQEDTSSSLSSNDSESSVLSS